MHSILNYSPTASSICATKLWNSHPITGMWISKLCITNSRSQRGIIQNAMHSLSCLEPFQQLAVITTSTHLARMLITDEVNFCILFKRLRARSCIRFKIDFKWFYIQISNEAMFSIFHFCPHIVRIHKLRFSSSCFNLIFKLHSSFFIKNLAMSWDSEVF